MKSNMTASAMYTAKSGALYWWRLSKFYVLLQRYALFVVSEMECIKHCIVGHFHMGFNIILSHGTTVSSKLYAKIISYQVEYFAYRLQPQILYPTSDVVPICKKVTPQKYPSIQYWSL